MLKIKLKSILQSLPAIIISTLVVAGFAFAWTEPAQNPPLGNTAPPLNTSSIAQSKAGGLIVNTGGADTGLIVDKGKVGIGTQSPTQLLDVAGYVKGTGLCIGTDCRTSWAGSLTKQVVTVGPRGCDTGSVIATCPAGYIATGGGGACGYCRNLGTMETSVPYGDNGWRIDCDENGNSTYDGGTAYVVCVKQ